MSALVDGTYVRSDGTLDTSRSKGVLAETHGVDALDSDRPEANDAFYVLFN